MLRELLSRLLGQRPEDTPTTPAVEEFTIKGFPVAVVNERPDIKTSDALVRLEQALALIERVAPERFLWLSEDLAEIWVRRFPCRAAFYPEPRACLVELTFLVNPRHSAAEVASSIVHEGIHARVAHGRLGRPGDKAQEERLCREAELAFGLAIAGEPGADVVVDRARQSLLLADQEVAPEIDWSEAARRVADADRAAGGQGPTA
jgi:hypothetical protein